MVRLALWLLLVALILGSVGWLSNSHVAFEVLRVACVLSLGTGMLLLIFDYARSPEAPNENKP